jgi:CRISPR-associated protein Cmr5
MAQKRAAYALESVLHITNGKSEKEKKEFKAFTAGAPSMILQNGFGQTLAFWQAKGSDKHLALFDISVKWLSLKKGDVKNTFASETDVRQFLQELCSMKQNDYLKAQSETLALLEWIKRFANADLT